MIIAIDGPAAAGKSTVAKSVAQKLQFRYMDTGAMYRAVTWKALHEKIDLSDPVALTALARQAKISFSRESGIPKQIFIDDIDVSRKIRSPKVENTVSMVAKVPGVRQAMVEQQRKLAVTGNYVVEGRDIGTVVFPDAHLKVFISASLQERARRRSKDMQKMGHVIDRRALEREIVTRDKIDSTRDASPLSRAKDAYLIDTTNKSIDQVVSEILDLYSRNKP